MGIIQALGTVGIGTGEFGFSGLQLNYRHCRLLPPEGGSIGLTSLFDSKSDEIKLHHKLETVKARVGFSVQTVLLQHCSVCYCQH